uniref:Uncharacterized protein n=1 Tax=Panagrolaimus superbus TaxID=310955 RepID=A0A914Z2U9_9BILA
MNDKKVQELRSKIAATFGKDHVKTIECIIELASLFSEYRKFNEAFAEFKSAKEYSANLENDDPKKAEFIYAIDCGLLDSLTEVDKDLVPEALNEFKQKYPVTPEGGLDLIKRQNVSHLIGHCYYEIKKYDEARPYLALSVNTLEQLFDQLNPSDKNFNKKEKDYKIRKAQILYTFTQMALVDEKYNEAKELAETGLDCLRNQKRDGLYYFFLSVKRICIQSPEERLQNSLEMFPIWKNNKNHKLKEEELNVFYFLFYDYLAQKDFENAEQQLWKAFNEKEEMKKEDEENSVVKDLIEWYRLRQRMESIDQINDDDLKNNFEHYKKFERIAFGLFNLKAFEMAFQFYEKLLQATPPECLNKKMAILALLIKCSANFAKYQGHYLKCFTYSDQLYFITKSLMTSDCIEIALCRAISLTKLDSCSFEEKKNALNEVKDKLENDRQFVKFYKTYIQLLKSNQNGTEDVNTMMEQLQIHQARIQTSPAESETIKSTTDSTDEYDEILVEKIFSNIQQKWKKFEKVELLKKKINDKDCYGFTPLHKAVEKKNFEEIHFLIDECGYKSIIDKQEASGKTPLFMAVMEEKYEIVSFLIKSGASSDISTTDKRSKVPSNRTPLMEAVSLGSSALIRLLISNGANPLLKDAEDKKASSYFEDEEFEKTFAVAEFDDLKEAMELLKNAETEREIRDEENDQQDDDVDESNIRKRLNEGTLNVSKRTRRM